MSASTPEAGMPFFATTGGGVPNLLDRLLGSEPTLRRWRRWVGGLVAAMVGVLAVGGRPSLARDLPGLRLFRAHRTRRLHVRDPARRRAVRPLRDPAPHLRGARLWGVVAVCRQRADAG